jgi:hypothetical protein
MTRIILAMLFLAVASSLATAQSTTIKPMTSVPASGNTPPIGQPKAVIPPAARAGEKGLRTGEGALIGEPVEVKRRN